jgi:hypothetical protein
MRSTDPLHLKNGGTFSRRGVSYICLRCLKIEKNEGDPTQSRKARNVDAGRVCDFCDEITKKDGENCTLFYRFKHENHKYYACQKDFNVVNGRIKNAYPNPIPPLVHIVGYATTALSIKRKREKTAEQISALEGAFSASSNPDLETRESLASDIGLDVKVVTSWFGDKRKAVAKNQKREKEGVSVKRHSEYQLKELSNLYKRNTLAGKEECSVLAEKIGLSLEQVRSWFTLRRKKDRRDE